jgi:mRNA-degrading endonuclease YafQ of YafQ-DinJ toxin-antitoxin module
MKFDKKNIILAFFGIILLSTMTESKSQNKEEYWITPLIKAAKSFLSFAQVPYCNPEVINALACPLCSSILDNSYKVKDIIQVTVERRDFKAVILQSDNHREIVVTFGAPKLHKDPEFYSHVYTGGYTKYKNAHVETIFAHVYQSGFDHKIRNTVSKLLNKHKGYNVVLVGHSFGGALAALSAFDLYHHRVITEHNAPKVYSYGALKVGDNDFVNFLNRRMKVIRIIKNTDLAPVLQNCNYVSFSGKWDCSVSHAPKPNNGPAPVSPGEMSKTYYPHTFNMAHGGPVLRPHSFLEKATKLRKVKKNKNKDVDYYYGGRNHEVYYKHADNPIFTWQPIGSEVIFNKSFKKWQVCSFTPGGNGMCGVMQHPWFDGNHNNGNYFHKKIDEC